MELLKLRKIDPVFLVIISIACIFIFSNLSNIYLWQDEGTTAVVARNTLTYGLPYGYKIFIPEEIAFNPEQIWYFQPWMQFYLTALSFLMFGESTWAARFSFAVLGLGTCILIYFLMLKLVKDRLAARISVLLLTFSVPFLLHVRQCRYYALTAFLSVLAMLAYWRFFYRKKYGALGLAVTLILAFHSNYAFFACLFGAFFIHYLVCQFKKGYDKKLLLRDISVLLAILIFTAPFLFYIKFIQHVNFSDQKWSVNESSPEKVLTHIKKHAEFYTRAVTKYIIPAAFFALLWLACCIRKKKFLILPEGSDKTLLFLIVLTVCLSLIFLIFVPDQRNFRYLVFLLPLFYALEGVFFAGWIRKPKRKILTVIILAALVSSNVLFRPQSIKFPVANYLYEITHDYDDCTEGIVKFLKKNASPGETVKTPYDATPIIFYCKYLNVAWVDGENFAKDESYPDWIIYRRFWMPDEFFKTQYYKIIKARYQEIPLTGYRDLKWGNMPDPGEHRFRTETDFLEQVPLIYKKIE